MSIAPWSFSKAKAFKTCPKQFYHTRILKEFPQQETEAMRYGTEFHQAAEDYIRDGTPLPAKFDYAKKALDALNAKPGEKLCEFEMGLTENLEPCDFDAENVWWRGIADLVILDGERAWVVDYKGLALDTKIPTPSGWTTMRDVAVGDKLFDMDGKQCSVIGKSEVKHLPCYKITFDDTSEVVCDEEHLWRLADGSVKAVTDIHWGTRGRQRVDVPYVDVAKALDTEEVQLPIDPYVLGLWLADGTRNRGVISKPDQFVWDEILRRGYYVNMDTKVEEGKCPSRTVYGLEKNISDLGCGDKQGIPNLYLRAGYAQRLDLLRGLMDGDGSANPTRKQCVYMTTCRGLAEGVAELLCSLGQRPLVSTTTQRGFGKTVTAHPVSFRPVGIMPFLLPRKAAVIDHTWGPGRSRTRRIEQVEQVPTVPTQCIAVDSPSRTFLCTERMIPTHNTGANTRYADTGQLELMALALFKFYPDVQRVSAGLLFTVAGKLIKDRYTRDDEPRLWEKWMFEYNSMRIASEKNIWNPNPSGLCKRHCPVISCPHNGGH